MNTDSRFDGLDHWLLYDQKFSRSLCKMPGCELKSSFAWAMIANFSGCLKLFKKKTLKTSTVVSRNIKLYYAYQCNQENIFNRSGELSHVSIGDSYFTNFAPSLLSLHLMLLNINIDDFSNQMLYSAIKTV